MQRRWWVFVLALTGCGDRAREAEHASPSPSAAETATAVDDPAASPALVDPPASTPTFHPVVSSEEWTGLHPLLDGSLMISAGPKLLRVDPAGTIHDDSTLLAGIELPHEGGKQHGLDAQIEAIGELGGWWTVQVGGTWPSAAFLTLAAPYDHDEPYDVYRWASDRWSKVEARRTTYIAFPRVIRAWTADSLLAWRDFHAPALDSDKFCSSCPDDFYETPEYKSAEREIAKAKQLTVLAAPAKGPSLAGRSITAFDALPSGEVFVALQDGSLLVLGAANAWTTVSPPGGIAGSVVGLIARAPNDVLGFGSIDDAPYLVRWNGHELDTLTTPACEQGLASLSIVADIWWAICATMPPGSYEELNMQERAGSLWRRQDPGGWQRVELGEGIEARIVVARAVDDVWVASYGRSGTATVLHTRDHGEVIALGGMREIVGAGFFANEIAVAPLHP